MAEVPSIQGAHRRDHRPAGASGRECLVFTLGATASGAPDAVADALLNGPQVDPAGKSDVMRDQRQVDDLLESWGF